MTVEIERRFLTTTQDWREKVIYMSEALITQCYPPELQAEGTFVRIRQTKGDKFTLYEKGVKGISDGLSCSEEEVRISKGDADHFFSNCYNRVLSKLRQNSFYQGFILHIDQFLEIRGEEASLVVIEIEFSTLDEARNYVPPKWLGHEITGKHKWSNFELCVNGIPLD